MIQRDLSIAIIEDDVRFADEIETMIRKMGYRQLSRTDNAAEALELLLIDSPDFVIMNIDIQGRMSGIEIAEKIAHLKIPILFFAASKNEAIYQRAQQIGAVGYLLKPINEYTLETALRSVLLTLSKFKSDTQQYDTLVQQDTIYFKRRNAYEKMRIREIRYISSDGNYTHVHGIHQKEYLASTRLNEFSNMLPRQQFLQIHRSFIVNLEQISSVKISGSHLWVGDTMLPISRRLKKAVFSKLNMMK